MIQFKLGRITNDEIKRAFLKRVLGNCTRGEVERFTAEFRGAPLCKDGKTPALARIDWHRRQGHLLVLATASFDFYADAIGRSLGFDHVIATRAAWHNDRIKGEFDGENLRGEAKLTAVTRALTKLDCGNVANLCLFGQSERLANFAFCRSWHRDRSGAEVRSDRTKLRTCHRDLERKARRNWCDVEMQFDIQEITRQSRELL